MQQLIVANAPLSDEDVTHALMENVSHRYYTFAKFFM